MKATIIGAGNLGSAIACGLAHGTFLKAGDITCVDPSAAALAALRDTGLGFVLTNDVRKAIPYADIIILTVKPYQARETIAAFGDLIDYKRQMIFSGMGGVGFDELESYLFDANDKKPTPVLFRLMLNLAVSIGESMTFISPRNADDAQIKLAESLFGEMGRTMVVAENLLSPAMAVSSCGLAYAMRYMRASMEGAIEAGFGADEARDIVLQTIKGAIGLLLESNEHPEVAIDKVATRGGYTIRGLNAMEEHGFTAAVIAGIRQSK